MCENNKTNQLIILGNGFDLSCGLHSSYSDFFDDRFDKIIDKLKTVYDLNRYKDREGKLDYIRHHICEKINSTKKDLDFRSGKNGEYDYFYFVPLWKKNLNRWDIIFIFAELCLDKQIDKYQWQDVESLIYEVVSHSLIKGKRRKESSFLIFCNEKVTVGVDSWNAKELFEEIVNVISYVGNGTEAEIANELMSELKKFEIIFSDFIAGQFELSENDPYVSKAIELIRRISRMESSNQDNNLSEISVLSFNYSLDERFSALLNKKISQTTDSKNIKSWTNIHGISSFNDVNASVTINVKDGYNRGKEFLPAPIFGIDNRDIIKDNIENDFRVLFTKPYRVIDSGVNRIRTSYNYTNTDLISVYGHSLSRADYSYFETIFDEVDLYDSDTVIEYFYYQGKDDIERLINKQEAIKNLFNLLTDYGKTLSDNHGTNIVNKLNLENRLNIMAMDELP